MFPCLSTRTFAAPPLFGLRLPGPPCLSGGSRCPEHISALKNLKSELISAFYWVLSLFSGIAPKATRTVNLYVVEGYTLDTIRSILARPHTRSLAH